MQPRALALLRLAQASLALRPARGTLAERIAGVEEESDRGTLFSSGLIAGGSVCGIAAGALMTLGGVGRLQWVGNQCLVAGRMSTRLLHWHRRAAAAARGRCRSRAGPRSLEPASGR